MSCLDSNIPSTIFHASVSFEILRIARTTTELNNIVQRVNLWLTRMKKEVVNVPVSFYY